MNFPGKLEKFKLLDLYSHFIKKGFRNVTVKKIIILCYLVTWSKELREGSGKCLQMEWNSSVSSDVFWILLLGRVFAWFCSSRLSWPLPALTVERCVRFLVDLRVRTKRSPDVPMCSDLPS